MAKYMIKGREMVEKRSPRLPCRPALEMARREHDLGRVWAEPHVAALEEAAGGDAVADEVPRR
jgi:hypothetical protein